MNVTKKVVAFSFIRLTWDALQPKAGCDAQCGENVEHSRGTRFANDLRYVSEYMNTLCVGCIYICMGTRIFINMYIHMYIYISSLYVHTHIRRLTPMLSAFDNSIPDTVVRRRW